MKTPNALDGNAGMTIITNKLECSLDLHDLEKFIDKKYCEIRKRDGTNRCDSSNLSTSKEVQSPPNRNTKYGTFENSPSSAFYMDIDDQFDKDICCGNCREGRRGKNCEILEKGFIKYLTDQIEFLREEIKAKNKMIDHLFTLKLWLRASKFFLIKMFKLIKVLIKLITKLFSTTAAHTDQILKKIATI